MTKLPKCCRVQQRGSGGYDVVHTETDQACNHRPSGGTGGRPDGRTRCNRIIGSGDTKSSAIADSLEYFADCCDV